MGSLVGAAPRPWSRRSTAVGRGNRSIPDAGRHVLIRVTGPLAVGTSQPLRTAVAELAAAGQPWVLVDRTDLSRLDRVGVVALVGMRCHLRAADGCLHVLDRSGVASAVLIRSGLARLFPVDSSLAGAAARDARAPETFP